MPDIRRELIDLGAQRANHLTAAENALAANDQTAYDTAMAEISRLNNEMNRRQNLIDEQERNFTPVSGAERRDMINERVNDLRNGRSISFNAVEIHREIKNALLAGSGEHTEPSGGGTVIHDPVGAGYSSIIDQVRVMDMTGLSSWQEPYVRSGLTAASGDPKTVAGTARPESTPSFGIAEIRPYEVSVTAFVDKNIRDLTNAAYYEKVYSMAMTALRQKICDLIVNGDGAGSPVIYGVKNAKNKKGEALYANLPISGIDASTLDELYFAYGDDESVGAYARLLLTKPSLKSIGALRNDNLERVFKIARGNGSGNIGVIEDGGTFIPYTLTSAAGGNSLLYGDPQNYLLGLFGDYSITVDTSVKSIERMVAILGDVKVGGNLVVDKGFVNATIGG